MDGCNEVELENKRFEANVIVKDLRWKKKLDSTFAPKNRSKMVWKMTAIQFRLVRIPFFFPSTGRKAIKGIRKEREKRFFS